MTLLEEFNRLKKDVEQSQRDHDRAAGALDQVMKRLKTEFDCKTIKEAEEKKEQLQKESEVLRGEFEFKLEKLKEEFQDKS